MSRFFTTFRRSLDISHHYIHVLHTYLLPTTTTTTCGDLVRGHAPGGRYVSRPPQPSEARGFGIFGRRVVPSLPFPSPSRMYSRRTSVGGSTRALLLPLPVRGLTAYIRKYLRKGKRPPRRREDGDGGGGASFLLSFSRMTHHARRRYISLLINEKTPQAIYCADT